MFSTSDKRIGPQSKMPCFLRMNKTFIICYEIRTRFLGGQGVCTPLCILSVGFRGASHKQFRFAPLRSENHANISRMKAFRHRSLDGAGLSVLVVLLHL